MHAASKCLKMQLMNWLGTEELARSLIGSLSELVAVAVGIEAFSNDPFYWYDLFYSKMSWGHFVFM